MCKAKKCKTLIGCRIHAQSHQSDCQLPADFSAEFVKALIGIIRGIK